MTPLVSVVIPSFDSAAWAREAVASVLRQTVDDVEILLVDDGSGCEDAVRLAELARHPEVRLIRNDTNLGNCAARRRGWSAARGRFVALLDDDDRYLPHHLETCLKIFREHPDVGAVYSRYVERRPDGSGGRLRPEHGYDGRIFEREVAKGSVKTSTLIFRRELLAGLDDLIEGSRTTGEYEAILRLAWQTRFAFVPEPLVEVFDRPDSVSKDTSRRHLNRARVLERLLEQRPDASAEARRAVTRKLSRYLGKAAREAARTGCGAEARRLSRQGLRYRVSARTLTEFVRHLFA